MNVPDSEILKKVRQWIKYGDEDIQVARHVMKLTGDAPYRLVAYHAQQCAEKYLKAYLVYHRVDFPYTHRILLLLELCPDRDAWDNNLKNAEELTPFAVSTRYPGEDEIVTESEARRAVDIAQLVRKTIRSELQKKGVAF